MNTKARLIALLAISMPCLTIAACWQNAPTVVYQVPQGYHGPLFVILDSKSNNTSKTSDGNYLITFNPQGFCVLNRNDFEDSPYHEVAHVGSEPSAIVESPDPSNNNVIGFYHLANSNLFQSGRKINFILYYYGTAKEALNFQQSENNMNFFAYVTAKWPEYFK